MIDQSRAREIAVAWLWDHPAQGPTGPLELSVLDDSTLEIDFGWVFFYTSVLHRDTGDFKDVLVGNAPLIVDRRDGALRVTWTARPVEYYIDQYRRERAV